MVLLLSLFYTATVDCVKREDTKPDDVNPDNQNELENRVNQLEGVGFLLCWEKYMYNIIIVSVYRRYI